MYWPILQGVKKYLRPTTDNVCRATEGFSVSLNSFQYLLWAGPSLLVIKALDFQGSDFSMLFLNPNHLTFFKLELDEPAHSGKIV